MKILEDRSEKGAGFTTCSIHNADLSDIKSLAMNSESLFRGHDSIPGDSYNRYIFINNAGSLGPLHHIGELPVSSVEYLEQLSTAVNLNVTSSCFLTSSVSMALRPFDIFVYPVL